MVQTSKLLALIGAILSILGTFFFSLYEHVGFHVYGIGGILNIGTAFAIAGTFVEYLLVVAFILFILAALVQVFGVPSKLIAIITGAITVVFCIFIILGNFIGGLEVFTDGIGLLFANNDWINGVIPVPINLPGVGLGTYIATVGGILTLVSGFLSRE